MGEIHNNLSASLTKIGQYVKNTFVHKSGDIMTGNLQFGTESMVNGPKIRFLSNKRNYIWAGYANDNGSWYLWDTQNDKGIIASGVSGNYTDNHFYGGADILWNVGSNCTTSKSTWNAGKDGTIVFGQRWSTTNYTYTPSGGSATTITDTGDFSIYLTAGSTTSNVLTANMAIDGSIYAGTNIQCNHLLSNSSAASWIDGQRYNYAALNVGDATNTNSYWPWIRQTNTASGKWFSFGTIGNTFRLIGSSTSRTDNSYDHGMYFDVGNGELYTSGQANVSYLRVRNQNTANEGGEILLVSSNTSTYYSSYLDNYQGTFRVHNGSTVYMTVSNDGIYAGGSNGWFRTYGSRGLYFQDYGGGWHMSDTTWIRAYNGKSVYIGAGKFRSDAADEGAFTHIHASSSYNCRFGVGSGGANHGVYSGTRGGWIIYASSTAGKLYSNMATTITSSDERLKENFNYLTDDRYYNLLDILTPYSYNLKIDGLEKDPKEENIKEENIKKEKFYGFKAQDVEKAFSSQDLEVGSIVSNMDLEDDTINHYIETLGYDPFEGEKSMKGVSYGEFIPLLWSFVKRQKDEIENLKQEIKQLKGEE